MEKIVYKTSPMAELFTDGSNVKDAFYKGVTFNVCIDEKTVSIWTIESKNQGKGEVQEMIDLLKKDFPDKEIFGSVPLNPVAKHIFDKKGIKHI